MHTWALDVFEPDWKRGDFSNFRKTYLSEASD
jgi:hypothetical protein